MEWEQSSRIVQTMEKSRSHSPHRSLSTAEKKYAHLDKEGLAIIFGVKKFHDYLFGRKFQIKSDHQPLQHLFDSTRTIPQLASARLQRWALILSAYNYTISYKPGDEHANADSPSRLPLPQPLLDTPPPGDIVLYTDGDPPLFSCHSTAHPTVDRQRPFALKSPLPRITRLEGWGGRENETV